MPIQNSNDKKFIESVEKLSQLGEGGASVSSKDKEFIESVEKLNAIRQPAKDIQNDLEGYNLDSDKIRKMDSSISTKLARLKKQGIPVPEEYKQDKPGTLDRIFSIITAAETAPLVRAMQEERSVLGAFKTQLDKAWTTGIRGKEYEYDTEIQEDIDTATYSDVLEHAGWSPEDTPGRALRSAVGLGLDIVADPTTWLTFGTMGGSKVFVPGMGYLNLTDEGISVMKKTIGDFGEEAGKKGMATLINETGEKYVAKRALARFGKEGKRLVPWDVVENPAKQLDKVLERIPYEGALYKGVKGLLKKGKDAALKPFNYFDKLSDAPKWLQDTVEKFEKAARRGAQADMNKAAMELSNKADDIIKSQGIDIVEDLPKMIERGENITGVQVIDDFLEWTVKRNKKTFKGMKEAGFEVGEISNYFKRILTDDGKRFLEDYAKEGTLNKMVKSFSSIFSGKKAPGQKGRKLFRVVSEAGDDVTFKKNQLGLRKLDKNKITKKLEDEVGKITKLYEDRLQKILNKDLAGENESWKTLIKALKEDVTSNKFLTETVERTGDFSDEYYETALKYITKQERLDLIDKVEKLQNKIFKGLDDDILNKPLKQFEKLPKKQEAHELMKGILDVQNSLAKSLKKFQYYDFVDESGQFYKTITEAGTTVGGKSFMPLTTREINEQMRGVMKEAGMDVDDSTQFFNENVFTSLMKREEEYQKMMKSNRFFMEMEDRFAFKRGDLGDGIRRQLKDNLARFGEEKFTKNGVTYIKGDMEVFGKKMFDDEFIPAPLKKHLKKTHQMYTGDDETVSQLLGFYDKALRLFKKNVTGYFPGFHTRNFFGATFNNFLAGVKNPKRYAQAGKILKYKKALNRGEDVADEIIELGGKKFKMSKLVKEFDKQNLFNQPGIMDVMRNMDDQINAVEQVGGGVKKIASTFAEAPRKGFEFVENQVRVPLFLDRIAKGDTFEESAKQVYKYHFDYAPDFLTSTEKNIIKRVIPFYTWTKNNIPLQMENIVKQPGKYAMTDKLRREVEAISGKERVKEEREYMPDWMSEMFTIRMPHVKSTGEPFYLQLDLPMEDLNKLNATDIANMMSPLLKYPAERYFNKDFFFGNELYNENLPRQAQTKETINGLKKLPDSIKEFLGIRETKTKNYYTGEFEDRTVMDSKNLHFLQSLFTSRWYSSAERLFDPDMSSEEKITSLALGQPLRPLDIEKQKWYNMKEKDIQLRDYINHLLKRKTIPYKNRGDEEEFIQGTDMTKNTWARKLGDSLFRLP